MMLLTKEIRRRLPKLGSTEKVPLPEKKVIVKFFNPVGSWTWYAVEGRPEEDEAGNLVDFRFFGLVDGTDLEWGDFLLSDLESVRPTRRNPFRLPIERDLYFGNPKIKEIRALKGRGWWSEEAGAAKGEHGRREA